ncbi:MAG: zf-HC2 domain-containing protein [Chloroflexi bacterium]|nr:zf-HC2 domain-containing protein [Chloroflexota bacterium]
MNLRRNRTSRPDDWPSSHVRAKVDLSDRLDSQLDPAEAGWLETHLAGCPACRSAAAAYETQRLEIRALLDRMPSPPRDLWARTAAAIEAEARFRDDRSRIARRWNRTLLAPSAVLAAALVVAVAVGTLTSSQRFGGDGTTESPAHVALASSAASAAGAASAPGVTPIPVERKFEYVARASDGALMIKSANVDEVCPASSPQPCDSTAPTEDHGVTLDQGAKSVFGSADGERVIVYNSDSPAGNSGTVSVVALASGSPEPTRSAAVTASPNASPPRPSLAATSPAVEPTPSAPGTVAPSEQPPRESPSPTVEVTPSPDGSRIEIARNVILVGQSASYSRSGDWFAFTARPVDRSVGPDIYLWKVGDRNAKPVTTDHRSVFGSWTDDTIVGSTVDGELGAGTGLEPSSFALNPRSRKVTSLGETGQAWRPAVDPTGRKAVYWSGTIRVTDDPGFAPDSGRLVIGDWSTTSRDAATSSPPESPADNQATRRNETTIVSGEIEDWDARWDRTGTHLAVWIANKDNPAVGRLSLYAVDSSGGRVNLKTPLLDGKLATAGFSISDGTLVWAESGNAGATAGGKIQLLAWTDHGVGTVETVAGPVIIIR